MLHKELCYHSHHARWVVVLLQKSQNPNSTQCHIQHPGSSQEEAAEQQAFLPPQRASICSLPVWRKKKILPFWKEWQRTRLRKKPPVSCWAHTAPQQNGASVFLLWFKPSGTKLYTKQRGSRHRRQHWKVWAWCVSLLHFLTTSSIIIVTHNTIEYNCCSDYLQPLH